MWEEEVGGRKTAWGRQRKTFTGLRYLNNYRLVKANWNEILLQAALSCTTMSVCVYIVCDCVYRLGTYVKH